MTEPKKTEAIMEMCFFLLPFVILAGRAAQAIGLYLFTILLPLIFCFRMVKDTRFAVFGSGLSLMVIYFIFPINDLWLTLLREEPYFTFSGVVWGELLKSQFSTSVGITGIALFVFAVISWITVRFKIDKPPSSAKIFLCFCNGMMIATVLFSVYMAVQFFTGFNFTEIASFRPDRHLGFRFYRVTGFSNHPLSLASLSLAIFSFFWALFWRKSIPEKGLRLKIFFATISFFHFLFILASGSRVTTLIAAVLLVGLPLMGKIGWKVKLAIALVLSGVCLLGIFATGLFSRFQETLSSGAFGGAGERKIFWQVHWAMFKDAPFFGQGHFWLYEHTRDLFYGKLGFGDFSKKYNAHNLFLEILCDLGLVGSTIIVTAAVWFVRSFRRLTTNNEQRILVGAFFLSLTANLVNGLTQNTLFDSAVSYAYLGFIWMIFWAVQLNLE